MEQTDNKEQIKEDRKVQAENMRLKKQIKALELEIEGYKKFIGGL